VSKDGKDGVLRRAVRRLAAEDEEIDDAELMEQVESSDGATAVSRCTARTVVTVLGTVRSMTLRPRAGTPTLEVELYDGTAVVTLVWLGRREIAGISPGRKLRATGRITSNDAGRIIFNPRYELVVDD
jgi:RecG-like helicase